MGAFLVNFHVRTDSSERVCEALREAPVEHGWMAAGGEGWVSFWDEAASTQNADRIESLAGHVSDALQAPVIAFLVHDSDILCYWLYDAGKLLDQYNSCPGYWDEMISGDDLTEDLADEASLAADCEVLARYCLAGTDPRRLEELLAQWTRAAMESGEMGKFVFEDERLRQLAQFLGLDQRVVSTDYGDFDRELSPDDIEAVWVGAGEPPERGLSPAGGGWTVTLPPTPLYDAAIGDDTATIERLVAEGADINAISHPYAFTALAMAAGQASPATLRRMVALGADVHKSGGATPLRCAVQAGRPDNVRVLAELGADVHESVREVGSLLHVAVLHVAPEVVRVLLELGVDPVRENARGHTPLRAVQFQLTGMRQALRMVGGRSMPELTEHLAKLEEIERLLEEAAGRSS